ncbi:ornithine aminotransferase [Cylindrobasidium torrendii FP15055 ss-10]|uniref:ornithine aminotransferase n=1 Tax=Cylindrobasidium torrendii FP15055 ss-10 TaxID=1314674 RepID=A0A0D7BE61_9AGAR|nr:ornithine aminotransferase [Cylindrobasidium torrendii FP15055 ss-10]
MSSVHLTSADVIALEHEHGAHNYHPLPVVFDKGLGAIVWDPEGRRYIDMLSAYSAVNQGHCHPRIVATLIEQAQRLTLSSRAFYNSSFGPFAKKITQLFGYDMVLPMNTGAEAVETGLKVARKWAYVKKGVPEGEAIILSVENNFHGRTLGVISMSTDPDCRIGFGPFLKGVGPVFTDKQGKQKTIRYGNADDVEEALELYGDKVAAFLVEPIQGEAGIVVPPQGYLQRVAELCKKHRVLLICDEIQTGMCRTGKMLASDWDNIKPDVVLLGKALSGGLYPVSAVLANKEIMLCIAPGEHGSTYGGNPLGCAVATTALDVLVDEKLSERAEALGKVFRDSILDIQKSGSEGGKLVKEVRGRGLLNAVVIDEAASKKGRTAWQLCLLLKSRGVLAKPTHVNIIRFAPPLVIKEEELKEAVKIIGECLDDLDKLDDIPGEVESEVGHKDNMRGRKDGYCGGSKTKQAHECPTLMLAMCEYEPSLSLHVHFNVEGTFISLVPTTMENKTCTDSTVMEEQLGSDPLSYPDGGLRAWLVVVGCFIYACVCMSYGWVWGVLQDFYHTEMFPQANLGILTLAGCLSSFITHSLSYGTGGLGDRFRYKTPIALGTILTIAAWFSSAFSTKLWHVFLTQGVFLGVAQGLTLPLYMSLPAQWFHKRRGFATGIATGGSGIGGGVFSLVLRELLSRYGHRDALLIYSGLTGGLLVIGFFLLQERRIPGYLTESKRWLPEHVDGKFYSIACSVFFGIFGFLSPYHFMATYTKYYVPSLDPESILVVLPLVLGAICAGIGRLISGLIADTLGPMNAFFASFFFGGILQMVFWPFARSYAAILAYSILNGLVASWFMSLLPVVCAKLFGVKGLSTITGFMILANSPGQLAGSPIGGAIYDASGHNWIAVAEYSGGMMLLGSLCSLYARFSHDRRVLARV